MYCIGYHFGVGLILFCPFHSVDKEWESDLRMLMMILIIMTVAVDLMNIIAVFLHRRWLSSCYVAFMKNMSVYSSKSWVTVKKEIWIIISELILWEEKRESLFINVIVIMQFGECNCSNPELPINLIRILLRLKIAV